MESSDPDDLIVKLELLNSKRESLCPGFFHWFDHNTRKLFVDSVIQSAKFDGDLKRFYYQNDIESMHSVEKKKFKMEDIITTLHNLQNIIQREEDDEVRAIYQSGKRLISNLQNVSRCKSCITLVE